MAETRGKTRRPVGSYCPANYPAETHLVRPRRVVVVVVVIDAVDGETARGVLEVALAADAHVQAAQGVLRDP